MAILAKTLEEALPITQLMLSSFDLLVGQRFVFPLHKWRLLLMQRLDALLSRVELLVEIPHEVFMLFDRTSVCLFL